ncbi:MAG: helix-turn-helix transcriptional regulator [Solobacterium sp.]|nr:helix-turn-helix transcriptional regulator [Solobacterium sp.]MBR0397200.1 helix-turn-helix transcriptional regulator [Eubacterium sp.]
MKSIQERNHPLADNLQRIISEKGFKQIAVAEKAGMTGLDLTNIIKGRKIVTACDVMPLAMALGVDANALFRIEGEEST